MLELLRRRAVGELLRLLDEPLQLRGVRGRRRAQRVPPRGQFGTHAARPRARARSETEGRTGVVGALAAPRCKFESVMGPDEAGTAERRRADSSVLGSAEVRRELRREKPGAVASRSAISRNSSDG